jgi:hypothetical protein
MTIFRPCAPAVDCSSFIDALRLRTCDVDAAPWLKAQAMGNGLTPDLTSSGLFFITDPLRFVLK